MSRPFGECSLRSSPFIRVIFSYASRTMFLLLTT